MPGYDCQVIMAGGGLRPGASIELSADAPMRPPTPSISRAASPSSRAGWGVLLAVQELLGGKRLT